MIINENGHGNKPTPVKPQGKEPAPKPDTAKKEAK